MKKGKKVLIFLAAAAGVPLLYAAANALVIKPIQRDSVYNEAVACLESDTHAALNALKWDIPDYLYPRNHDTGYRDQYELIYYADALYYFSCKNYPMAESSLRRIDSGYGGLYSDEINELRPIVKTKSEEQQAENEKKAAEEAREQAEKDRIERDAIFEEHRVPYVGMPDRYIGASKLGAPTEKGDIEYFNRGEVRMSEQRFVWKKNGKTVFSANSENGKVVSVHDYTTHSYYGGSSSEEKEKDEYNSSDYSNEEDFYEDNYDDFFDYEDAANYWNEYN